MFADDLDDLVAHHDRFELISWFDDDRGLPQADSLAAEVTEGRVDRREILACGPPPFLDVVDAAMDVLGVPADQVKRERFTFGEPRTPVVDTPSGPPAEALLSVCGADYRLDWPRGTVLLDRMIEEDIEVPYVCRSGYCGACVFTLISGEVTMIDNSTLDGTDLAEGRRLACQSLPATDTVGARFDD